jgi:hypothetical protein
MTYRGRPDRVGPVPYRPAQVNARFDLGFAVG